METAIPSKPPTTKRPDTKLIMPKKMKISGQAMVFFFCSL